VAPSLRDLRGRKWRRLVDRALEASDGDEQQLAFALLLIRLAGCLTCHPDSYRALRGCTACAAHVIRRHRGDDDDLTQLYERASDEIVAYLSQIEARAAGLPQAVLGETENA
jgi:hypothetical protein